MQTQQLLQALQNEITAKGIIRNKKLIDDIIALLSQQPTVSQTDELSAKEYADSQFIMPYEDLKDAEKDAWVAFYDGYLAGLEVGRQQLSQQQQQRQYSEEDMIAAFTQGVDVEAGFSKVCFEEWITKYNNLPK